jgi:hypothetical protein
MMSKISVIIPTFNGQKTLGECINSIQAQILKPSEIMIIDNASTDKATIKFKNSKVKLFRNTKNLGVTGGRNRGIKEANKKSDYLFFFDHDMVADKKMLEELIRVAESSPDIGIVTPKIYYWGDKKRIWSAGTGINLWTGQVLFRGGRDMGQYQKEEEVQVAPAAMLVKKKVMDKIRGFDERYFATYEDTDFCFRAKKAGLSTFYAPKAIAYHNLSVNPQDESDRLLERAYWVGRNRVVFMKDFGKNFLVFLLFLPVFIGHYLWMALKSRRIKDGLRFIHGTISGVFA